MGTFSRKIALIIITLCISFPMYADFKAGGKAYKKGNYETAAKEFLPLAKNNDHRAMYALGSMYAVGRGVPMDLKESFKWFQKAANHGRPDAQYKLGLMYDRGLGARQNYRKALNWYGKSAKSGFGLAQYKLGQMYFKGHGVTQNFIKAFAWMKTAIAQGVKDKDYAFGKLSSELNPEQMLDAKELAYQYMQKYTAH